MRKVISIESWKKSERGECWWKIVKIGCVSSFPVNLPALANQRKRRTTNTDLRCKTEQKLQSNVSAFASVGLNENFTQISFHKTVQHLELKKAPIKNIHEWVSSTTSHSIRFLNKSLEDMPKFVFLFNLSPTTGNGGRGVWEQLPSLTAKTKNRTQSQLF